MLPPVGVAAALLPDSIKLIAGDKIGTITPSVNEESCRPRLYPLGEGPAASTSCLFTTTCS
jgi:hypothetical protein